mmetsp:Transcript_8772/g.15722  ORF Transcript_8772/g.15722 Transcript_8772/m.15722 type:complete len:183 (+) Transcript_8772:376-924(+)
MPSRRTKQRAERRKTRVYVTATPALGWTGKTFPSMLSWVTMSRSASRSVYRMSRAYGCCTRASWLRLLPGTHARTLARNSKKTPPLTTRPAKSNQIWSLEGDIYCVSALRVDGSPWEFSSSWKEVLRTLASMGCEGAEEALSTMAQPAGFTSLIEPTDLELAEAKGHIEEDLSNQLDENMVM